MLYRYAIIASTALLASCAPPLVWGSDDKVEQRLLSIVPLGSAPVALDDEARRRGWENRIDDEPSEEGSETHFNDTGRVCRSRGGVERQIVVARYNAPFTTIVETLWLFDSRDRLRDICIRSMSDAI